MFLHPHIPKPQQLDGFLYKAILAWLEPVATKYSIIYSMITFLLLFIQAVSINNLVNVQRLMQKPSYLTGMSYLLITSLFGDWFYLSSPLIINTLLIWVLFKLCNLHNSNSPKTALFNIGMITGVATFIYFPSIGFSLLIIVGLIVTRPFRLPEWVIVLLGILTPYYFLAAWVYLADRWKGYHFPGFTITVPVFHRSALAYTAMAVVFLSVVIGMYFIQDNMRRQVVHARKSWNLVFLYLLVALLVPFFNASQNFDYWILTAVPLSAIAGAAFLYPERKGIPLVLHWAMVIVSVLNVYF